MWIKCNTQCKKDCHLLQKSPSSYADILLEFFPLCYTCSLASCKQDGILSKHPQNARAGKHQQINDSHVLKGKRGESVDVKLRSPSLSRGRYVSQSTIAKLQWSTMLQRLNSSPYLQIACYETRRECKRGITAGWQRGQTGARGEKKPWSVSYLNSNSPFYIMPKRYLSFEKGTGFIYQRHDACDAC